MFTIRCGGQTETFRTKKTTQQRFILLLIFCSYFVKKNIKEKPKMITFLMLRKPVLMKKKILDLIQDISVVQNHLSLYEQNKR